MFVECLSLKSIDVTKFNTEKVYMGKMFDDCSSLTSIYVSNNNINKFKEIVSQNLLKIK